MNKKLSVKAASQTTKREEKQALTAAQRTADSFQNFAMGLGIGTSNPTSSSTYGFNPITRNRILLEWIHRGSWIGGLAVDVVADDMTRAGVEFTTQIKPEQKQQLDSTAESLKLWGAIGDCIKWARLYGGAICVALIEGQDLRSPLRLDTVGPDQFKGLVVLDRWQVDPSLEDLITEYGPDMGQPKFYRVTESAPALRGQVIHHSRVMVRMVGCPLPYQQQLTENLWGISIFERLYDRLVAFDSATTGASQLVYKSYLRTLKIAGYRDIVAAGGAPETGLRKYVQQLRQFQGQEGISVVDLEDEFQTETHGAFSGLADILVHFGQQLSGALQIPLVRLFGQSPAGLNSTGESDLRMYYDHINKEQNTHLRIGVHKVYQMLAQSLGVKLPKDFQLVFSSLWQLDDAEKASIAGETVGAVMQAHEGMLISQQAALKELRQSSRKTGVFTNITDQDIAKADDLPPAPEPEIVPASPAPKGKGKTRDRVLLLGYDYD